MKIRTKQLSKLVKVLNHLRKHPLNEKQFVFKVRVAKLTVRESYVNVVCVI
jgi:hypothetical protein